MSKIVPEYAELRSMKTLIQNYKGEVMISTSHKMPLKNYIVNEYRKLIEEDFKSVYLIELSRISARKWQVVNIFTDENSYNVEDEKLFLSSINYNLKVLTEQIEVFGYNSFFGIRPQMVSKWEYENYPELFSIKDENGNNISQAELKIMYEGENNK